MAESIERWPKTPSATSAEGRTSIRARGEAASAWGGGSEGEGVGGKTGAGAGQAEEVVRRRSRRGVGEGEEELARCAARSRFVFWGQGVRNEESTPQDEESCT